MDGLSGSLLLVGGGKMGSALLHGWLARGVPARNLHIVEPDAERAALFAAMNPGSVVDNPNKLALETAPELIVFAVKPQMFDTVLPFYRRLVDAHTTVLSIAAGKPIAALEAAFGTSAAIVRAMPNTPAAVGRGISVLCANGAAHESRRSLAESMMQAVGEVAWVDEEDRMHAVTAVSGSGPAYVFLLAEALAVAGAEAGLPKDLAAFLARKTVAGAGALMDASDEPADELRRNVTSPGGTTEAALEVLQRDDVMKRLFAEAVAAAAARSKALA